MNIPGTTPNKAVKRGKRAVRQAIPWLPAPMECRECGALCESSWSYDPRTAAFDAEEYGTNGECPSWECPDCGAEFRRDKDSGLSFEIWRK